MIQLTPATRLKREGRTIYAKVTQAPWGADLTWRNARGAIVRVGRFCRFVPLFAWRRPA